MLTVQPWKISGFTARSTLSPRPFPIMGKGAALEDISPAAPGRMAQPEQAVKGKPPQAAVLCTLDRLFLPVLNSRRRRGIYHQSPMQKCARTAVALGHFVSKSLHDNFDFSGRMAGGVLGAALITKIGRPPVGPGYIAQKSRPIFKDDFLRNVIVSIYFLVFSSKFFRFRVPNKS